MVLSAMCDLYVVLCLAGPGRRTRFMSTVVKGCVLVNWQMSVMVCGILRYE